MAIIKFKGVSGFDQGQGNLIDSIKARMATGVDAYSSESAASFTADLKQGHIDASSFESTAYSVADSLGLTSEQAHDAMERNDSGLIAATVMAMTAAQPKGYMEMLSNESAFGDNKFPQANFHGQEFGDVYSTESFDNQVLTEFMPVSIGLAYTTGQQSPGMEAIYRTINLTPEQGGIEVETPLLFVANTQRHAEDGSPTNFNYRRVIDATIDHTILVDNATRLIPSYNDNTKHNFVSDAVVSTWPEKDGGRVVTTGALATGVDINLFGLGQLDAISRVGQLDYSEALDRNIGIDQVYLSVGGSSLLFRVKGVPFSRFTKGAEGNAKRMQLNCPLSSLIIDGNTTDYEGTELSGGVFDLIKNGKYTVRLKVNLTGEVDVEHGSISVNPGIVKVVSITDENGALVDLSDAGAAIVSGFSAAELNGWTVDAWLTNSNHRFLGQRLNTRSIKERLVTRTRSPIFIPMPVGEDRDQTALDQLTFAVMTNKEADGLTALIGYHTRMMEITGGLRGELTPGDFEQNVLPLEGIGRYLINPYVQTVQVDLTQSQSLDTKAKIANAQEHLSNKMRSVWFDIMQTTNFNNAARYVDGGQVKKKFKATFMTSDTLQRFITVGGDSRTLGADVPFEIFSNVDRRLREGADKDAMYMVITREGDGVDPLTSGVLLNTPSLVSSLTLSRDNTHRKELVIQPRYAHYNLCPIIVKFEVTGAHQLLEENLEFAVSGLDIVIEGGAGEPVEP